MNDILFTPLRLSELEILIENSVTKAILKAEKAPTGKNSSNLLTLEEAAKFLKVANSTVYRLVSKRMIPFHKAGRLYFVEGELFEWATKERKSKFKEG